MQNRRHGLWLLLLLSLALGAWTGRDFFFRMAWLFAGLLVASVLWCWFTLRQISLIRQTLARRAQVGSNLGEHLEIRNRSWLPGLWLELRDFSSLPGHRVSQVVPALGRRKAWQWDVDTKCVARGEFRLGPMTLASGDPFGFHYATRQLEEISRIIIFPATVGLESFELPFGEITGGNILRRRTHYVTTNATGVRDYAPGDSFNRIHWRSSARRNSLMVKEFELDPLLDIWILMDFSADSLVEHETLKRVSGDGPALTTDVLPRSTEEYGVVAAASLARHFIEEADRAVGFMAWGPKREILQPENGERQLNQILQILAIGRSVSEHSLEQMLAVEMPHMTRGTSLVIVTSSLDLRWVREVRVLKRRGVRPLCIFVDPFSFGGEQPADDLLANLHLERVPVIPIRMDDDIAFALSRRQALRLSAI